MEVDNPGMHTTNTIDFEYVISGEVWLELDDGKEVRTVADLRDAERARAAGVRPSLATRPGYSYCLFPIASFSRPPMGAVVAAVFEARGRFFQLHRGHR